MSIIRPAMLLDFANTRQLDPRLVYSRAAGTNGRATGFDAAMRLRDLPANAPIFDQDFTTGQALGLSCFPASVNWIFNPRNEGSGGTAMTSGNMPTSQAYTSISGVSVSRAADRTIRGMNGAVYSASGTAAGSSSFRLTPQATNQAGTSGDVITASAMVSLLSGSIPAGVTVLWEVLSASGGSAVANTTINSLLVAGQDPVKVTAQVTLDAGTTAFASRFRVVYGAGVSATFDLWVGPTQNEKLAFATPFILPPTGTTNATGARSAQTLSATLADFGITAMGDEGTLVMAFRSAPSGQSTDQFLAEISDGTANETIKLIRRGANGALRLEAIDGGVSQGTLDTTVLAAETLSTVAVAWKANDMAICRDGLTPVTLGTATMPTIDRIHFGTDRSGANSLTGHLRRAALYPRRLANAVLQQLAA